MTQEKQDLPTWDMTVLYPALDSTEFDTGFEQVVQSIDQLQAYFDEHHINRTDPKPMDAETVSVFDALFNQFNDTLQSFYTMQVYLYSFLSTDSRNDLAQAKFSVLQPKSAQLGLLGTRLTAWIGSLDVESLLEESAIAQAHQYTLLKAKEEATHLMSPAEEALAAEMRLTGGSSWQRMFNVYNSQITVDVEIDGEMQTLPLTAAQNLAFSEDRDLRKRAYHAVLDTLKKSSVPIAAALNAIKGETLTLSKKRGWDSPLDMVLFDNAMDRETLDAMMDACKEAFPDFQRYLKARARVLDLPVLHWYDQLVPVGQGTQSWSYDDAAQFVIDQFGTYSPKLKNMAETAFREGWIDAGPREGKSGGAFCMSLREDESRILMNFESQFTSVSTMAHELGHAYHNVNLAQRTPLQKDTPMTLAETASTFCQKIVENAALEKADAADQLIIIDGLLEYATRVILGATSNFLFEEALFEKRAERELSVDELCALDVETQKATRGDAIDPEFLHPFRWAYVPHYYGMSFYNFPYIFGLLFGLGLYAQYQEDPETFKDGYDKLLSSTGMGHAAELAAEFGIDLRQPAFWRASLDVLRADIDRFEALVDG